MIRLGARPDAGFDDPIRMLSDCHRRIERFLDGFAQVANEAGASLTDPERILLESAIAYFVRSGTLHTHDEDDSLFPRLRDHVGEPRVDAVLETADALEAEHELAAEYHTLAEALGRRWLKEGYLSSFERERLRALLASLQEIYRRHIAIEDSVVFPVAAAALTDDEKAAMGREMAARRGVRAPTLR